MTHDRAAELRATRRQTQQAVRTVLGAGVVIFALMMWFSLAQFAPFAPYHIYGYEGVPVSGCAGESIDLTLDREVREPWYLSLRSVGITTYLENTTTGSTVQRKNLLTPLLAPVGREQIESPIERVIPYEAGDWRVVAEYRVNGRVLGFPLPRTQRIRYVEPEVVTSLSPLHPRCRGN